MNIIAPGEDPLLPLAPHAEDKNPIWHYRTPNERYEQDMDYLALVDDFRRSFGVGTRKWLEVRVTGTTNQIQEGARWWDRFGFRDQVFWVFHKTVEQAGFGKNYRFYVLEPLEALRVSSTAFNRTGENPWGLMIPCLLIPVECCSLAWNETQNGMSEHRREGRELTERQKEALLEQQAQLEEAKKNAEIFEVNPEDFGIKSDEGRQWQPDG